MVSDYALTFDFCLTRIKIFYLKFNDRMKLFVGGCGYVQDLLLNCRHHIKLTGWDQIRPKVHLPHHTDPAQPIVQASGGVEEHGKHVAVPPSTYSPFFQQSRP